MAELKKYGKTDESVIGSDIEQPSDNLEIDQIMAKLEQGGNSVDILKFGQFFGQFWTIF